MNPPYSPWADWLDKFAHASDAIQALWILAGAATIVAAFSVVMRGLVAMVRSWPRGSAEGFRISPDWDPQLRVMRHQAEGLSLRLTSEEERDEERR